jgi:hypothetical protein
MEKKIKLIIEKVQHYQIIQKGRRNGKAWTITFDCHLKVWRAG